MADLGGVGAGSDDARSGDIKAGVGDDGARRGGVSGSVSGDVCVKGWGVVGSRREWDVSSPCRGKHAG